MVKTPQSRTDAGCAFQVKSIAEMGAYVSLLEYNNIEGMILLSELSRRRIRSISKLIKVRDRLSHGSAFQHRHAQPPRHIASRGCRARYTSAQLRAR